MLQRIEAGLRSPWLWLAYLVLAGGAIYAFPGQRRVLLLATLVTLAVFLAWLILAIERGKRARPALSLDQLDQLDGFAFERWVIAMLQAEGYDCTNVRDRGDFGVDLIARIETVAVGVQTKRYSGHVGNAAVQQVLAGCDYYGCVVAAVVTQSYFTPAAREQAARARYPVVLIDRDGLVTLVERVRGGAEAVATTKP